VLSAADLQQFSAQGFVRVPQAIPRATALACADLAIEQLSVAASGPWPLGAVRGLVEGPPVTEAASSPRLVASVGQLLRGEQWHARSNLGLFVVRVPCTEDPADTGWHIDASFQGPDTSNLFDWYVNHRSLGRGLLLLCLLTDVTADDAPTRILRGSHLGMPALLRPFGDEGVVGLQAPLPADDGEVALAVGEAGDVYLCHPFLVHAATWPLAGKAPRVIAQPPISIDGPLQLERPDAELSVVARAVKLAPQRCGGG
jgi:ectoine hydroxylase-related dioxygenase (phytanoyl-CoA dioxygenase family)